MPAYRVYRTRMIREEYHVIADTEGEARKLVRDGKRTVISTDILHAEIETVEARDIVPGSIDYYYWGGVGK